MNLNYPTGAEAPIRAMSQDRASVARRCLDRGRLCGVEPLLVRNGIPVRFPEPSTGQPQRF